MLLLPDLILTHSLPCFGSVANLTETNEPADDTALCSLMPFCD